jgi:hypothetical membrane protein
MFEQLHHQGVHVRRGQGAMVRAPLELRSRSNLVTALLLCGVFSSVLYLAMDAIASLSYDGYSYTDQAVSELFATGAPTRTFWVVSGTVYNALIVAASIGAWMVAGSRRRLRWAAALLGASAILTTLAGPWTAMDQRGAEETLGGSLHGPVTLVMSVFFMLAMGFASGIHGKRFRWYTIATMVILVVFGAATGLYVPRLADDKSTPGMGLVERVNIYAYLLWVAVWAVSVLPGRANPEGASRPDAAR